MVPVAESRKITFSLRCRWFYHKLIIKKNLCDQSVVIIPLPPLPQERAGSTPRRFIFVPRDCSAVADP